MLALAGAGAMSVAGALVLPGSPDRPARPSPELADGWQRGVALTDWTTDGLGSAAARAAIDDAIAAGADRVVLSPTLYMEDRHAAAVAADPGKTSSDGALRGAIDAARDRGLAVTLKPHVDVADGTPRTAIAPADRAAWFASYRDRLLHYAAIGAEEGVDELVIGVELSGVQGDEAAWRALAADARATFDGRLAYAANWDAVDLAWWDAVDLVGVDAYMPLTAADDPTPAQLAAGWRSVRDGLAALHERTGRPVLLTEIGYAAREGAAVEPWEAGGAPDPAQQARLVNAAFEALHDEPWMAGVYWWDWPVDGAQASAFSLRGRPAEVALRRWQAPHGTPARAAVVGELPPLLALALVGAAVAGVAFLLGTSASRRRPSPLAAARPVVSSSPPSPSPQSSPSPPAPGRPRDLAGVLLRALSAHDPLAAEHSRRVGALAERVAGRLGMSAADAERLHRLGELHDVGKLQLPLNVLGKHGRLSPAERRAVRRWGAWSAELVAHVPELAGDAHLLEASSQLAARAPLDVQVLAACDAYDSMTHPGNFRPAMEPATVVAMLRADRRFDARVVDAVAAAGATARAA